MTPTLLHDPSQPIGTLSVTNNPPRDLVIETVALCVASPIQNVRAYGIALAERYRGIIIGGGAR